MYGRGISKSGEIVDLGVELNVIQKSGSWFSYSGNKLGQGRDAVKQLIEDNPELMEELEKKIKDKIAGSLAEETKEKEKPVLEKAKA
jgi:recombination protein RecA